MNKRFVLFSIQPYLNHPDAETRNVGGPASRKTLCVIQNMLQYSNEYLRDPYIKELKHSLYSCYKYTVYDGTQSLLSVLVSQKLTLVYYGSELLRLDRNRRLFAKDHHPIYNQLTGEKIGGIEFPDWQTKTRCIIRFSSGKLYSFVENCEHRSWLKPSTWGHYRFELSNSDSFFMFDGNRKKGTISIGGKCDLILVALGLFIIDHKFRTNDETSG